MSRRIVDTDNSEFDLDAYIAGAVDLTAVTTYISWAPGLGPITHIIGPTDQALDISTPATTGANSKRMWIYTGDSTATPSSGDLELWSGNVYRDGYGIAGGVYVYGGYAGPETGGLSGGYGGEIGLYSGGGNDGGNIDIFTGGSTGPTTNGWGGELRLRTGNAGADGRPGIIELKTGNPGLAGRGGDIEFRTSYGNVGRAGWFYVLTSYSYDGAGGEAKFELGSGLGAGSNGGDFNVTAGTCNGGVRGGNVSLTAGAANSGSAAGEIRIRGGSQALASAPGGTVYIWGGAATGSNGIGGEVQINGGTSYPGGAGGPITIQASAGGGGTGAGPGGSVNIYGGAGGGTAGAGGNITVEAGSGNGTTPGARDGGFSGLVGGFANGDGTGGQARVWGGGSASGTGGSVEIKSGTGSVASGNVVIYAESSGGTNGYAVFDGNNQVNIGPWFSQEVNISRAAGKLGFYGGTATTKPAVTGSQAGASAITLSLLAALAGFGLVTDSTTP